MLAAKKNVWVESFQDSNVISQSLMSTFLKSRGYSRPQKLSRFGWQAFLDSIVLGEERVEFFHLESNLVDRTYRYALYFFICAYSTTYEYCGYGLRVVPGEERTKIGTAHGGRKFRIPN